MTIVTNKQYEKEEEDFRAKKKKVSFGGASEEIKARIEARESAMGYSSGLPTEEHEKLHREHAKSLSYEESDQRQFDDTRKTHDRVREQLEQQNEQQKANLESGTAEQLKKQSEAQDHAEKARAEMEAQSQQHHQGRSM